MANVSTNRRKRTRVAFRREVEIFVKGNALPVKSLEDISLKGVFVQAEGEVPLGTACQVVIRLAGAEEEMTIRVNGRVTRLEENGLAIEFTAMEPESYFHLRNIVLYNAPDPDAVEEELQRPGFK